jgi:hypothetical protein
MRRRHELAAAALGVLAAEGTLHWLGRTYGSNPAERARPLPGDELVKAPDCVTDHATTIEARPEAVWPWIVQMGWGRGQWYTARWVDRLLFPNNGPSADAMVPHLQHLEVGDRVLDGPPETNCSFIVAALEPNRHLVLHSTEHLPPGWAERGVRIDFSWTFVIDEAGDSRTRFHFRSRSRLWPFWARAFYKLAIVPADFVMARQMMHGLTSRVERTRTASSGRAAA